MSCFFASSSQFSMKGQEVLFFCFFVLPDNHMLWWLDEWSDHHETIRSSFYTQLSMEEEEVKFGNIQIPLGYYRGTIANGSKLEAMIGFPPPYYRNKTRWSSECMSWAFFTPLTAWMLGVKRCQTRRIEVNKYLIGCMENGPPWENSNRQHLEQQLEMMEATFILI